MPSANERFYGYEETASDVYEYIFNDKYNQNIQWACGKWISVSREEFAKTPVGVIQKNA